MGDASRSRTADEHAVHEWRKETLLHEDIHIMTGQQEANEGRAGRYDVWSKCAGYCKSNFNSNANI